MKKFSLISVLLVLISILLPTTISAEENISLIVNCNKIQMDVNPIIQNERTLIPIRALEKMDFLVSWDDVNKKVKVSKDNSYLELQINNVEVIKNTNNVVEKLYLDTPPIIYNSRTMVPVRFISETMGYIVEWDGKTKTVTIKTDNTNCSLNDSKSINSQINDFMKESLLDKKITLVTKIGDTKNVHEIKNNGNRVDSFIYKKDKLTTSMECELNRGICTINIDNKKEASVIDKKTSEELKSIKTTIEQTVEDIKKNLNSKINNTPIYNETPFYFINDESIFLTFYTDKAGNVVKLKQTKYLNNDKTDFSELVFEN